MSHAQYSTRLSISSCSQLMETSYTCHEFDFESTETELVAEA